MWRKYFRHFYIFPIFHDYISNMNVSSFPFRGEQSEQPLTLKLGMLLHLLDVILCFSLLLSLGRFRLVQKTGQACTALAFSLRRTTEFLVALADYTIKCFDKGRMDTSTHLSQDFFNKVNEIKSITPATVLLYFFQTQSSWSVGCGATREQFPPSLSTAQVAMLSPRPQTRRSFGIWTPSRGRGSSTSDSLLAFRG